MTAPFTRRDVSRALLASAFAAAASPALSAAPRAATPLFDFAIAGGQYHWLYEVRDGLVLGERLLLRAEPENPHDANAVAVYRADGVMLGYVPRIANQPIARLLAQGARIDAVVVERLDVRSSDDLPDNLAFTFFLNGDPRIRLVLNG
jgi:hypothetical protein